MLWFFSLIVETAGVCALGNGRSPFDNYVFHFIIPTMTRKHLMCKYCGKSGDPTNPIGFVKDKKSKWGVLSECAGCRNKRQKDYHLSRPGYVSTRYRDRTYGLPDGWYSSMMKTINGKCMICGNAQITKTFSGLCVDHDHTSSSIRGLLCSKCNQGLGMFNDRPDLLRYAADYLMREPLIKR
jgi:hypothetical protein